MSPATFVPLARAVIIGLGIAMLFAFASPFGG